MVPTDTQTQTADTKKTPRPPVVVVMGHVDHGKSTLLDTIRKTNVVASEAGGITQHLSAYEVAHSTEGGAERKITFLDTPGHEAFAAMRSRGARVADVAVLVVAADDGVKAQTKEALRAISEASLPFVVAINKIDLPHANVDKIKQELAENGVFLEGYGGSVSFVPISAKKGDGISELLDLILLAADLEELGGDPDAPARGVVIEAHVDPKKGASATLIVTDGTLASGMYVVAGNTYAPTRIMENFRGESVREAGLASPVRVVGFTSPPPVGVAFTTCATKQDAEKTARAFSAASVRPAKTTVEQTEEIAVIPLVVKTDVLGTEEAIVGALGALDTEQVKIKLLHAGVGAISDNDVRLAGSGGKAVIAGFNVRVEPAARELAERRGVTLATFTVIYELTAWLTALVAERTPTRRVEERQGMAKVLKTFSRTKEKQVIGGEVLEGALTRGAAVKILRRDAEIGRGKIVELQQQKLAAEKVDAGSQCGMQIEARVDIAPGDRIESFQTVVK